MKKIFAVSDIHGHFKELIETLNDKGFDENNKDHMLVVCGDSFDRGRENLEVYQYLKRLSDENKAIVIKGNHDLMLIEYLNGTNTTPFNYINNGLNETLGDFLHQTSPFETWALFNNKEMNYSTFAQWTEIARKEINEEYPDLLQWLTNMPYYYETENYIFTHGMIDCKCDNWRNSNWKLCVWSKPKDFFNEIKNTDKTIVVGHINCGLLRKLANQDELDNSIFTREDGKVIGLDACTILTKKVNVLVLEENIN